MFVRADLDRASIGKASVLVTDAAEPFAGESLTDAGLNGARGWTVVGLSRDGTVLTGSDVTIGADDEVFVAGSDDTIQEFERTVDTS